MDKRQQIEFARINHNIDQHHHGAYVAEGGIEAWIKYQERDRWKTQWALDNGWQLLRISYDCYKQMEELITEVIGSNHAFCFSNAELYSDLAEKLVLPTGIVLHAK
jgi:hypothetical protein